MLKGGARQEVTMPVEAMLELRRELTDAIGDAETIRRLERAGVAAGRSLARRLAQGEGQADDDGAGALRSMAAADFWKRLSDLLSSRGWGRLEYARGAGVGELLSDDWIEADGEVPGSGPRCHFGAGMIGGLLAAASGRDVAVVELECRASGAERCRFAFGAPAAVDRAAAASAAG